MSFRDFADDVRKRKSAEFKEKQQKQEEEKGLKVLADSFRRELDKDVWEFIRLIKKYMNDDFKRQQKIHRSSCISCQRKRVKGGLRRLEPCSAFVIPNKSEGISVCVDSKGELRSIVLPTKIGFLHLHIYVDTNYWAIEVSGEDGPYAHISSLGNSHSSLFDPTGMLNNCRTEMARFCIENKVPI